MLPLSVLNETDAPGPIGDGTSAALPVATIMKTTGNVSDKHGHNG